MVPLAYREVPPPAGCARRAAPVLLVHGFGDTGVTWGPVLAKLGACRRRLVVEIPPTSAEAPRGSLDADTLTEALAAILAAESPGRAAAAVGHSAGGAAVARLAAVHPERVDRLALVSAPVRPFALDDPQRFAVRNWQALLPLARIYGPHDLLVFQTDQPLQQGHLAPEHVGVLARQWTDHAKVRTLVEFFQATVSEDALRGLSQRLPSITASVLLIHGDSDMFAAPPASDFPHAASVQREVLAGTGHHPPQEQPARVAALLDALLALPPGEDSCLGRRCQDQPDLRPASARLPSPAAGDPLYGPAEERWPVVGAAVIQSPSGAPFWIAQAGLGRGSTDRRYPLEAGRTALLLGGAFRSTSKERALHHARLTARAELIWRYVGGVHLDAAALVRPRQAGFWLAAGYAPSLLPWTRAFVGYGSAPGEGAGVAVGIEINARLTGILYLFELKDRAVNRYPRDFRGHGPTPPDPRWPGGAKIAISMVLNYEEGGENCLLHGDAHSEAFLSDIAGAAPWSGMRHWNMESIYDYGARAGFWRLHRLFTSLGVPVTIYGVTTALARNPEQVAAMKAAGWEIASHGLKWVDHRDMPEDEERRQIAESIRLHTEVVGEPPLGWYTGRCSVNTVRLTAETGQFEWISDTYDDDLPYWREVGDRDQLVVPYTLEANDMRFATAPGYIEGEQFFTYLKDTFDTLYAEGEQGAARMFSVGLHCRLVGRPGKAAGLRRFLDYALRQPGVWFARRIDIARHWAATHPHRRFERPSQMSLARFIERFGSIVERSPWVAERAWALELGPAHDSAVGLHSALARAFRSASAHERMAVLRAHPDLAGKLAQARRLTPESTAEQASAALDALTDDERETFQRLNADYSKKHGFPFIIAVRDHTKASILEAFRRRIDNDTATEFATACGQVERIAELRLRDLLP